jgi:predicted ATPase
MQAALSWEMKAAIPLARLRAERGRSDEARLMLEDKLGRFSEGFGNRDLTIARQLLEEIS